jgi:hypothetical protein
VKRILASVERARAAFALFWSLWLARETLRVGLQLCGDVEIPPPPTEALRNVEKLLSQAGYPQIVDPAIAFTAGEGIDRRLVWRRSDHAHVIIGGEEIGSGPRL